MKTGSRAVPLLLLLAGLCFYVLRVTEWFSAVPGDLGDARFNSVVLEHLFRWASGEAASLWSPDFFYPAHGTLAFSDNHFGSGVVYVLLRLAGLGREHAFDGWFAIGCMLNFISMYAVARKLEFSPEAAGVAAFVYAFCLPAMAQGGHAQLTYRFAIPLAFLSLLQLVRERRMARLVQLAGWGALQFYCSIYLGVFMAYMLAATMLSMLVPGLRPLPSRPAFHPERGVFSWGAFVALLALAAATAYLLLRYHAISKGYGFMRSPADVEALLPRPESYLMAHGVPAYQWFQPEASTLPMSNEHQMFMGFVPLLLSLCALGTLSAASAQRRRLFGLSFATLALLVLFTLWVDGRSLYQLAMKLPGVASVRAVSRIVLVMALPIALMAAIGVEQLSKRPGTRGLVSGLVIVLLSFETLAYQTAGVSIDGWRDRLAPLARAAEGAALRSDSVVYVTGRSGEPVYLTELDGMVFAQDRGLATLNGYSGNAPSGYIYPEPCAPPAARIYRMANTVLSREGISPEALLARTVWLPLEGCPVLHLPTGAASSPLDEAQVNGIGLSVASADADPAASTWKVELRIANNAGTTLHTLSRVGHPVRVTWRLVPHAVAAAPAWTAARDLNLSLPPGEHEDLSFSVPRPAAPGLYELEITLLIEGYALPQNLKMPIARTSVAVP
jgi:hypothetical protein